MYLRGLYIASCDLVYMISTCAEREETYPLCEILQSGRNETKSDLPISTELCVAITTSLTQPFKRFCHAIHFLLFKKDLLEMNNNE